MLAVSTSLAPWELWRSRRRMATRAGLEVRTRPRRSVAAFRWMRHTQAWPGNRCSTMAQRSTAPFSRSPSPASARSSTAAAAPGSSARGFPTSVMLSRFVALSASLTGNASPLQGDVERTMRPSGGGGYPLDKAASYFDGGSAVSWTNPGLPERPQQWLVASPCRDYGTKGSDGAVGPGMDVRAPGCPVNPC